MKLRAERAALLGFANHAAYSLEDQTARTPTAVNAMLRQLAPAAVANAKREAAALQARIDSDGGNFTLAPWTGITTARRSASSSTLLMRRRSSPIWS